MSDTILHKKYCRRNRQLGLAPNIRLGSPCRKGQCRKVAARVKVLRRKRGRAVLKKNDLSKEHND